SAETYATKYFLSKLFLIPVKDEMDPDYSPREEKREEATKLPPRINSQQVESLINLFRSKTMDNKERQTKFLEELDKVMEKRGEINYQESLRALVSMINKEEIDGRRIATLLKEIHYREGCRLAAQDEERNKEIAFAKKKELDKLKENLRGKLDNNSQEKFLIFLEACLTLKRGTNLQQILNMEISSRKPKVEGGEEKEYSILVEKNEFNKHFLEKYLPQAKIIEERKQLMNVQFYSSDRESLELVKKLGGIKEEKLPIFARGREPTYLFPTTDNKENIEQKITQLMRKEEEVLKSAIRSYSRFFLLTGSVHEKYQEGNKETTMYGWLDQEKLVQSLNDESKLKELVRKKVVNETARGIAGVLDLWLAVEFSKEKNYEKGHIDRKKKEEIKSLRNEDILSWIKQITSLHKLESLILIVSTDLF
ncbi:10315_t:CDS:2, partial [Cetraspora pellucida]